MSFGEFRAGTSLILLGLAKKVLIADTPASDVLFSTAGIGEVSAPMAWIGALCFYLQIYFDFSGYTDIAIGVARLFLVRFPPNFDRPYAATSVIDFWWRWHMTLSRFLRDYVYIPLGGGHAGPWRRRVNLMITMLVGGLWHGAGWTFVAWGGMHGLALALNHALRTTFPRSRLPVAVKLIGVQFFIFFSWIFFRSPDFASAWRIITAMTGPWTSHDPGVVAMLATTDQLFRMASGNPAIEVGITGLTVVILVGLVAAVWREPLLPASWEKRRPAWLGGVLQFSLAALVLIVVSGRVRAGDLVQRFIYFQF